ncbi:MAG: hypothetical protein JWQ83_2080 [Lacunisphaera sp.]|nr:hypothetical protein [Lacunisphaera sp.]
MLRNVAPPARSRTRAHLLAAWSFDGVRHRAGGDGLAGTKRSCAAGWPVRSSCQHVQPGFYVGGFGLTREDAQAQIAGVQMFGETWKAISLRMPSDKRARKRLRAQSCRRVFCRTEPPGPFRPSIIRIDVAFRPWLPYDSFLLVNEGSGMRSPVSAVVSFVIGIAFGVPGLCLLVFLCLLIWRPELATEWSRWLEANSPLAPEHFPRWLFNGSLHGREAWWGAGAMTLVLNLFGYKALRWARESLRPADQSSGGKAQVLIRTQHPCVGALLEGDLRLLKTPRPEQVFKVALFCRHVDRALEKTRESSIFGQCLDVQTALGADGWHVPFRFEVPANAPPSTVRDLAYMAFGPDRDEYSWFIDFCRADAWIAVPSEFLITLGPAPVIASRG